MKRLKTPLSSFWFPVGYKSITVKLWPLLNKPISLLEISSRDSLLKVELKMMIELYQEPNRLIAANVYLRASVGQ